MSADGEDLKTLSGGEHDKTSRNTIDWFTNNGEKNRKRLEH